MVFKKILLGMFLVVLFSPLAFAVIGSANDSFNDDFNQSSLGVEVEITSSDVVFDDEFSSCEPNARDVCLLFPDFGLVEGASMPYVLPKNGILNLQFVDGTVIGNAVLSSGKISEIVCCTSRDDFTHTVSVSSLEVVEEIKSSEDFLSVADSKLSSGEIVISANSFNDRVRLSVAKAVLRIRSWFR